MLEEEKESLVAVPLASLENCSSAQEEGQEMRARPKKKKVEASGAPSGE